MEVSVHYIVLHTYIVHYIINTYIYCVDVYILTLNFCDTYMCEHTPPSLNITYIIVITKII